MSVGDKRNNLAASIGQRKQPINETLGIYSCGFVAVAPLLLFLVMITGIQSASSRKVRDEVAITQEVVKLLMRVSLWRVATLQKHEVIQGLRCGKIALSGYGVFKSLSESQQAVSKLTESCEREAGELLTALFEYYKLLFCFYCLKSSTLILADKGATIIPAVECFFTLFWDEEHAWQKYKAEKTKFIKAAMMVVEGIENVLPQYADMHEKTIFVRKLMQKMLVTLPPCNFEERHSLDVCQRCCALNVFDMVGLGVVDKNVWKAFDLRERSYWLVKYLMAGVIVGCIVVVGLKKMPKNLRAKVKSVAAKGLEFVENLIVSNLPT